ncbi:CHAT domain-containing protein [Rubinisphaera brasiliensis]|uniref:PDZ/DHR/GLGF domain protein n=1 Tax=Rubinisphaera brasiliensis (strain ATCC 49424 / DSM 5305 / JCM 21570 / IAM 15109 / NBRC 103401 / IFAM 1448) TaxID=756272 RepID=F0SR60_RUBBR|nr:CHAT domain-containing protein [Rubinisphaera brasiliensis]ADY61307.1 PDZ/DHR/GLGF domain protein [Rubinisphaera brasiliensis DSM 5305]
MLHRAAWLGLLLTLMAGPVYAEEATTDARTPAEAWTPARVAKLAERDRLWAQAQQLLADGKTKEAIAAGEQVLAIERELFGDAHEELTGTLEWLSNQNLAQQKMQPAKMYSAELLRVQENLDGKDGWQSVSARWKLDYIQKVSKVDPLALAKMLAIEADYHRQVADGEHAEAAEKILELVPLEEEALGKDHPSLANTLFLRADRLLAAEEFAAAEEAAERALAIRRKALGSGHPDTALIAFYFARALIGQNKHAESLQALELARDAWRSAGSEEDAAWMDFWRGDNLVAMEHDTEAVAAYQKAADAFRAINHDEGLATAANGLGQALFRLEKVEDALRHFVEAGKAFSSCGRLVDASWMHSWRGDCLSKLGRFSESKAAHEAALRSFQELEDRDGEIESHRCVAEVGFHIGRRLYEDQRFENAAAAFRESFDHFSEIGNHTAALLQCLNEADAVRQFGDEEAFYACFARAKRVLPQAVDALNDRTATEILGIVERLLQDEFAAPSMMANALSHYAAFRRPLVPEYLLALESPDLSILDALATPKTKEQFQAKKNFADAVIADYAELSPASSPLLRHRWANVRVNDADAGFGSLADALPVFEQAIDDFESYAPNVPDSMRGGYHEAWASAICDLATTLERLQPLAGVKYLDDNIGFITKHSSDEFRWFVLKERATWLAKSDRHHDAAFALSDVIKDIETCGATNHISYKGALAGLIEYTEEGQDDPDMFSLEIAARQKVVDVNLAEGDSVAAASQLASIAGRMYGQDELDQIHTVLERAATITTELNVEALSPNSLVQVIGTWIFLASEFEETTRLGVARLAYETAWKLSDSLETTGRAAIRIGIADHLYDINSSLGQSRVATDWLERILRMRGEFEDFLKQVGEDRDILEDLNGQSLAMSSLLNLPILVSHMIEPDARKAFSKASELDLLLDRIDRTAQAVDAVVVGSTVERSRMLLWSELATREAGKPLGTIYPKTISEVVQRRYRAAIESDRSHPHLESLQTLPVLFSLIGEMQELSRTDLDAVGELQMTEVLGRLGRICDQLSDDPVMRRRPEFPQLLLMSSLGAMSFKDGAISIRDVNRVRETIEESCDAFESVVESSGGLPNEVVALSEQMRKQLDPFTFGQIVALHDDQDELALDFAIRGRGLGSRIAFSQSVRLADSSERKRPTWITSVGDHSLRNQFAILRPMQPNNVTGGNPTGAFPKSSSVERIATRLAERERYLFVSSWFGSLSNDEIEDNIGIYLVRPSSVSEDHVAYFPLGSGSASPPPDYPAGGVFVIDVLDDSVASALGLRSHDVILKFNDEVVRPEGFADRVRLSEGAATVELTVWRDGHIVHLRGDQTAPGLGVLFSSNSPRDGFVNEIELTTSELSTARKRLVEGFGGKGWLVRSATEVKTERGLEIVRTGDNLDVWSRGRSYNLFRSLFPKELWEELRECRRVYVSLPGQLVGLPLEALVVEPPDLSTPDSPLVYWLDVGPEVVYLPTGELHESPAPQKETSLADLDYVGVGGVDFGESAARGFAPLPGTEAEVRGIATAFAPSRRKTLLGADAIEAQLAEACRSARYLSIATHGSPEYGENILNSALILSRSEHSDGRLTLEELLTDWRGHLAMTELTILSACNTGDGFVTDDDGSLGLPFGFLAAGSRAVISSQWPVDDQATSQLFREMFRLIAESDDKVTAFTKARQLVRKSHPNPRFWAPFIYIAPN